MPGADHERSSSVSQQRGRFLDNLGSSRSSTCSSLLAVDCIAMVFNAFQINSYVFSKEIGANAKKVWSTKDQHTGICGVRTQCRSHHWPSSGDVWVRACNVWLPQCPSYSLNVVVHIGKQGCANLTIVTKFSPLPTQNDGLRFCLPWWWYLPAKSVNGEGDASGRP